MPLIDVSHPVSPRTAVWPGDRPFECGWTMALARKQSVNVGEMKLSTHTGTHVDAYLHFDEKGLDAAGMPLDAFTGRCIVVEVPPGVRAILPEHIEGLDLARVERILFKTRPRIDPSKFDAEITSLHPDTARKIAQGGVKLVGTDAASVDAFDSKGLESHHALARGRVGILENVALGNVRPGAYDLTAFPLRLVGLDASPVRAVLRS